MLIIIKQKNVALSEFILHDTFENLSHIDTYKFGSVTYKDRFSGKIVVKKTSKFANKLLFELLNNLENVADNEDYVIVTLQSENEFEFLNYSKNPISTNIADYAPCIIDNKSSQSSQLQGTRVSVYNSYGLMVISNPSDSNINKKAFIEDMPKYVLANYPDIKLKQDFIQYSISYSFTWNVASIISKFSNIEDLVSLVTSNDIDAVNNTPQLVYSKKNDVDLILITEYNIMITNIDSFFELDSVMFISNADSVPIYFEQDSGNTKKAALKALTTFE